MNTAPFNILPPRNRWSRPRTMLAGVIGILLAMVFPVLARADVSAFACEPEWAALLQELGGTHVEVYQATSPRQDPHRVEARPSLVARMRLADIAVCTGADLEVGWLPVLLRAAGNRKVQPGQPGYFMAAELVDRLDTPVTVDRSMGDVHPFGNPHVHLDPRNILKIAAALSTRLAEIDSSNAAFYTTRGNDFQTRWQTAMQKWEEQARTLKGLRIVTYHSDVAYLVHWLGLVAKLSIEPKPGIPPSTSHLAKLLADLKEDGADLIIRMAYNDPKAPAWLSDRTGIALVELPYTVGGTKQATDLFALFDDTISRLSAASRR